MNNRMMRFTGPALRGLGLRRGLVARAGFTLLEVMLVMGIIIMLAGLAVAALMNVQDDALEGVAKIKAAQYAEQCKNYKMKVGVWPSQLQDLIQRPQGVDARKWKRPFVEKLENDPWGVPFNLEIDSVNNRVRVASAGPDRKIGSEDDISNLD